jgi:hypothetical protein
MINTRAVGSELLHGQEKIDRIIDMMGIKKPITESKSDNFIVNAADGRSYGIFRENANFFIKEANIHTKNEKDFNYIGGFVRKTQELHESYGSALKRLNIMITDINHSHGVKGAKTLFEDAGQEYVLKQDNQPAHQSEPQFNNQGSEEDIFASADNNQNTNQNNDVQNNNEEDPIKLIQKLTGKLGQALRTNKEEVDNKMVKYVINSILSAVDLTLLTEEEKEALVNKVQNAKQPETGENHNEIQPSHEEPVHSSDDIFGGDTNQNSNPQPTNESLLDLATCYEQEMGITNLLEFCKDKKIKLSRYQKQDDNVIFESVSGRVFIVTPLGKSMLMTENNKFKKILI